MSNLVIPSHDERCYREGTKDVIFLFQWRQINLRDSYDGELPEGYSLDDEGELLDKDGNCCDMRQMLEDYPDHFYEIWHTDRVYLSREEGEAYGRSRESYAWHDGWRVYGVPTFGQLSELLKTT